MTIRNATVTTVIGAMLCLSACSSSSAVNEVDTSMTWQEAKAAAQATTLEIVALISEDDVVGVDQHPEGTLFSCDDTRHRWTGITNVTLSPGVDVEALVKNMEGRLGEVFRSEDGYVISNRRGITDKYVVKAKSSLTGAAYLFGEGETGIIAIDSWSPCFTLPEGVYPGGDF